MPSHAYSFHYLLLQRPNFLNGPGTTFKMEDADPAYMALMKEQAAYGHKKGVELGGYDLIVLDRNKLGVDQSLISAGGQQEGSACFASK